MKIGNLSWPSVTGSMGMQMGEPLVQYQNKDVRDGIQMLGVKHIKRAVDFDLATLTFPESHSLFLLTVGIVCQLKNWKNVVIYVMCFSCSAIFNGFHM